MAGNPVASPLFTPIALALTGLLGAFLIGIIGALRFRLRNLGDSVLFRRWKVWAVIAPIYSLAALAGPLPLAVLVAGIASVGGWEFGRVSGLPRPHTFMLAAAGGVTPFLALGTHATILAVGTVAVLVATGLPLILRGEGSQLRSSAFMLLGVAWVSWLPSHLVLLARDSPQGVAIVLALGLGVALSDVGAFLAGKTLGRRKLAPAISPNKTVEGLFGNLAGAYAGFLMVAILLHIDLPLPVILAAPVVIALGCVWGDLAESALKREFGKKDSGAWLPGFGGLLDRVDSLLVAAPLLFHFLRLAT